MSSQGEALNPYAILFAAITQTGLDEWSNSQRFAWDEQNIEQAPAGAHYGNDVFAIIVMEHKNGQIGRMCYDLQDYVYVDFGSLHWNGPLETEVHSRAIWNLDFEGARQARLEELQATQA